MSKIAALSISLTLSVVSFGLSQPATAVAGFAAAPHASQALDRSAERVRPCNRSQYATRIKNVRGTQSVAISHLSTVTYPGRTVIRERSRHKAKYHTQVKAGLSTRAFSNISAGGVFRKILSAKGELGGSLTFRAGFASTSRETTTVLTDARITIPAARSVAWFKGYVRLNGYFDYSRCDAIDGRDPEGGIVRWATARWYTFSFIDEGGQRCDTRAYTAAGRAAKSIGCR